MALPLPGFLSPLRSRYRVWRAARYGQRYGDRELALLPLLVEPDEIAIDVGANRGIYTWPLARLCRRVIAVEPHPVEARTLREGYGRPVEVLECALSDQAGGMTLWVPEGGGGELATRGSLEPDANPEFARRRAIDVAVRTIDSLKLDAVGFIKAHVEGHELAVLLGARQTLERCRPTLLVAGQVRISADLPDRLAAFLTGLGYRGYFLERERLRPFAAFDASVHQRPETVKKPGERALSPDFVYNFIYVHPERPAVLRRLEHRL